MQLIFKKSISKSFKAKKSLKKYLTMQFSNRYILLYTVAMCVVCAVVLSLVSMGLAEKQAYQKDIERQRNILSTIMDIEDMPKTQSTQIYKQRVKEYVVDSKGNIFKGKKVSELVAAEEWRKPAAERLLPVYEIKSEKDTSKSEYFVLSFYGFGLWNEIWSYVCLKGDMQTINGVSFGHKAETPGLGARISDDQKVYSRYAGKKIFKENEVVSIKMMKGEGIDYTKDDQKVDGMSGATLTAKGVNNMFDDYIANYANFLKMKRNALTDQAVTLK